MGFLAYLLLLALARSLLTLHLQVGLVAGGLSAGLLVGGAHLFGSSWRRRYSDRDVRKMLEQYAALAGAERSISPHLHAAQLLEQETALKVADRRPTTNVMLGALARQAGRLEQRETARKLADPALEGRWLALLPAGWRSYRQDGVVTGAAVKAALERAQDVD